ncbi:MAG: hypothetical protein VB084_14275 [Syntrophomonadaceae bacterium]|nr:hypothetical protein [Syntrophomonadaceae bacterium]
MKKEIFEKVIKSADFLIPSIFVFIGVTVYYFYEFYTNNYGGSMADQAGYWLAYLLINLFLQYVVFVNAKRQILNREKQKK